jgi:hypothetical protein
MDKIGEIYKITNMVTNKIYIGKTKKYYQNSPFGYKCRLQNHFVSALSNSKKNDCPKLYNSIRKHGKNNFKIELLCECSLETLNDNEIKYIALYDSTNEKKGYNISLGGGGRCVVDVSEEIREKISSKQQTDHEMNIKPYIKNNKLIGYVVDRKEKGVRYSKYFTKTNNSSIENYELANVFLDSIKKTLVTNENINKYNRKDSLPKNIHAIFKKDKLIGYKVFITKNKIKYTKTFQSVKEKPEILLDKAIIYKESILNLK